MEPRGALCIGRGINIACYEDGVQAGKGEWEVLKHLVESDRELIFPLIQCTTLQLPPPQAVAARQGPHARWIAARESPVVVPTTSLNFNIRFTAPDNRPAGLSCPLL
jgi:hypothetical protein